MASIILISRQRVELENFVHHAPSARQCCRALAVLWLAEGQTPDQVAELLHVSRQTVYNWAGHFQQCEGLDLRSRLADAPRQGRPPSALGIIDPRELGYHATVWTAPLLGEYLEQVHGIDISQKSVSFAIARLGIRWKRPRHQLALPPRHLAAVKRGLKRGLKGRIRTVLLMLDETIITETPPLYSCYGHIGEQVRVPITGNRSKRILHGAINVKTGDVSLLITKDGPTRRTRLPLDDPVTLAGLEHRALRGSSLPAHFTGESWLGRRLGDRGPPAAQGNAGIERDGPSLEAHEARDGGHRDTTPIDQSALDACQYIIDLSPHERLRQAGILSGDFWLTK